MSRAAQFVAFPALALGISGLMAAADAHARDYGGYYGGHMWDGDHMWGGAMHGWFLGPLMMIVWLAVTVGAVVLVLRLTGMTGHGKSSEKQGSEKSGPDAMDILRERFARGEIDKEEFEERRTLLER